MKYTPVITLDIMRNARSYRSECSCGWKSAFYKSQMAALECGEDHARLDHHVALQRCAE